MARRVRIFGPLFKQGLEDDMNRFLGRDAQGIAGIEVKLAQFSAIQGESRFYGVITYYEHTEGKGDPGGG